VDAQQGGPLFPNLLFSGFFIDKYPWNATLHAFKQFFFFFGKHLRIIQVIGVGDRYAEFNDKLCPLIDEVIFMKGMPEPERLKAAERIFLVVNKYDRAEDIKSEDVKAFAEAICPGYYEKYKKTNIFYISARNALAAQLILNHPDEGEKWLAGESSPHFEDFDKKFIPEYQALRKQKSDNDQACFKDSGLQKFETQLKAFLRDKRFDRDFNQAKYHFDNEAFFTVNDTVCDACKKIGLQCSNNPDNDLSFFENTNFSSGFQDEANQIPERFDKTHRQMISENSPDGQKAFEQRIEEVKNDILTQIKTTSNDSKFQKELTSTTGQKFRQAIKGFSQDRLVEFDEQIHILLDESVNKIAQTMITQFKNEIERQHVFEFFNTIDKWEKTRNYRNEKNKIIENLRIEYIHTCRGALFCRLMEFETAENISELMESNQSEEIREKITKVIYEEYEKTFNNLFEKLNGPLYSLFLYHIKNAKEKFDRIAKNMIGELIRQNSSEKDSIYRQWITKKYPVINEARILTKLRKTLQQRNSSEFQN
jgi:hypothetical protein